MRKLVGKAFLSLFCLSAFGLLFGVNAVLAQGSQEPVVHRPPEELDSLAQEISETTMSPFCPGRTISACPSDQAWKLRAQIRKWLDDGYSPNAVRQQLLMNYGEDVRGTPKEEGFGHVGWFAPAVFVLIGFFAIILAMRKLKHVEQPGAKAAKPDRVDEKLAEKIEQELKRRMQ